MQMLGQTSIYCRNRGILYLRYEDICALVRIFCLYYDLSQKLSALVVDLFYIKFLKLNVTICIELLNLSHFCFCLSSVADFSNTGARAPTSAGCIPFLPARRVMWFGHEKEMIGVRVDAILKDKLE